MTDPATNALATQMIYGEEEMQREIAERIRLIVREELIHLVYDPDFSQRFLNTNLSKLEQIARQAIKNAVASIPTY